MAPRRLPGPDLAGPDPVTERLFAVAVLAIGAVVAVVWAGAALAAALGGTWPLPAGLADAAGAAVRLPSHAGHPAAAWAAPARDVLPGAAAYWAAQGAVVAGVVAAVVAGARVWRRGRDTDGLGVDRSAAFAGRRDLGPLRVDGPVPGRLVLGRVGKALVATEAGTSVCLVGPSQSGKTTGLCVPVLLEQGPGGGAVLAASVKGDVYNATQLRRASLGEVKVFDPTCSVVARSATWSPLRAAGTVTGAQAAARALVDVASRGGVENGDFWMEAATDLLWSLMFVAAGTGATMGDVVRWVTTHDRPVYSGDGERSLVITTVAVEPDADGGLVGTAEVWLRHARQGAGRVGGHVVALRRVPELEATALALSAPDELAGMLVGHAMVRLAAADVARVRGRGAPPGGHADWARVLGWDPVAADHNRAELAAAMSRGCQAFLEEGHPAADVVRFVADLRRAVRVSWMASVRRPEAFGDPGGNDAVVGRFWRRVLAHVTPAELAGMGPVVDAGEHVGAWLLRRGKAEWAGVHEFNPLGARLARAMRRADLQPGYGAGFDPRGIGA